MRSRRLGFLPIVALCLGMLAAMPVATAGGARSEQMTVTIKVDKERRLVTGRLFTDAPVICGSAPISVRISKRGYDTRLAKVYVRDTYPEFENTWEASVRSAKGERVYAVVFGFFSDAGGGVKCIGDRSRTVVAP